MHTLQTHTCARTRTHTAPAQTHAHAHARRWRTCSGTTRRSCGRRCACTTRPRSSPRTATAPAPQAPAWRICRCGAWAVVGFWLLGAWLHQLHAAGGVGPGRWGVGISGFCRFLKECDLPMEQLCAAFRPPPPPPAPHRHRHPPRRPTHTRRRHHLPPPPSSSTRPPATQELSMEQLGFFVPPPLAIAHHLIRAWANHDGPWFPPGAGP